MIDKELKFVGNVGNGMGAVVVDDDDADVGVWSWDDWVEGVAVDC